MSNDTKCCVTCKKRKARDEFGTWNDRNCNPPVVRTRSKCKDCWIAYQREWRKTNPAKIRGYKQADYQRHKEAYSAYLERWRSENPDYDANRWLLRKFGITLDEYESMLESQGGVCAICKQPERGNRAKRLAVDHCHETGVIRGLLCQSCNRALGLFKDDVDLLNAAINYLTFLDKAEKP